MYFSGCGIGIHRHWFRSSSPPVTMGWGKVLAVVFILGLIPASKGQGHKESSVSYKSYNLMPAESDNKNAEMKSGESSSLAMKGELVLPERSPACMPSRC